MQYTSAIVLSFFPQIHKAQDWSLTDELLQDKLMGGKTEALT